MGKNWSTQGKTTVRNKRVGPLGSNGAPLLGSHSDTFLLVFVQYSLLQSQSATALMFYRM